MPDTDAIRTAVDNYLARFSAADREGWLDLWAEDATMEDPVGSPVRTGREEIGAFYDQSHGMADSIELRSLGMVNVCGNEAAFAFEIRPVLGGSRFRAVAIDAMVFDDETKIAKMRAYWDMASMTPATD
ncbi:MAG: nuclear transport factor 2 family protein [Acidimicrobiales bacterium]